MLSVRTNISAMAAQRHNNHALDLQKLSFNQLSSGKRVFCAAKDAAGLAVATNLDVRATSQSMAMRNANDGISLIQTAEGGMDEVMHMVQRMRELAVQASSDSLATTERQYVQDEFSEIQTEIDRIRDTINFNGKNLLDGSLTKGLNVHVGADNTSNDQIQIVADDITKVVDSSTGVAFDMASNTAMKVSTSADAQAALQRLDDSVNHVNRQRALMGSVENRLNNALSYLAVNNESLKSAGSRIMDADFATASALMTKAQTMSQASTAILAQANQLPQAATRLIG